MKVFIDSNIPMYVADRAHPNREPARRFLESVGRGKVTLADTDRARDLLCGTAGVSARDAVHTAVMINHGVEWIATFDRGFDQFPGIRRLNLP